MDVIPKMEIYCMELFSNESTCWQIAINCIYLSQCCISQYASQMTFCVFYLVIHILHVSSLHVGKETIRSPL